MLERHLLCRERTTRHRAGGSATARADRPAHACAGGRAAGATRGACAAGPAGACPACAGGSANAGATAARRPDGASASACSAQTDGCAAAGAAEASGDQAASTADAQAYAEASLIPLEKRDHLGRRRFKWKHVDVGSERVPLVGGCGTEERDGARSTQPGE